MESDRLRRSPRLVGRIAQGWQLAAIFTAQSGRPFSVWNGAAFSAGGDYNADGGGGAVGGGFYDRPDAPAAGLPGNFSTGFPQRLLRREPVSEARAGANGTLGRNTFRGPRYMTLDLALSRSFGLGASRSLQFRVDAYNA